MDRTKVLERINACCESNSDTLNLAYLKFGPEFPKIIESCRHIRSLNISHTDLNDSCLPMLSRFVNLETLSCNGTKLTRLPETLVNLMKLYCHDTMITYLPSGKYVNLKNIICSYEVSMNPVYRIGYTKQSVYHTSVLITKNESKLDMLSNVYQKMISTEVLHAILNNKKQIDPIGSQRFQDEVNQRLTVYYTS